MKIPVDFKMLFIFIAAFILFTPIGTLSHELGHLVVAQKLGYETKLHYGSVSYARFVNKEDKKVNVSSSQSDRFWITLGGPVQTMLTGVFGILILFSRRKQILTYGLKITDWLAVFLSLFWLRQVFNLMTGIAKGLLIDQGSFFGGDERKISTYLDFPPGTISIILATLGFVMATGIIFCVVPRKLRLTFILGGLIGGITGFILWMKVIGPMVLP